MSDVSQEFGSDEAPPPVNKKTAQDAALDDDPYFKKCPACGKFTRDATVCRHCGHDLPQPSKANFSRGERNVFSLGGLLAGLGLLGSGWLPLLGYFFAFAGLVTQCVVCTGTWLRTRRESRPGSARFAVLAILSGSAAAIFPVAVAIVILANVG